jgi:MFS family permease
MAGMSLGVLIGVAADSAGFRRSMVTGQVILALASLVGAWAQGPVGLLALRALEGLGFLLVVLSAPSLIRQLMPPSRLALYLGFWGTYMATGTSVALLTGPLVIALAGWPAWWGLMGCISALMALWVARQVPSDAARRQAAPPSTAAVDTWQQRLRLTLSRPGPWCVALTFLLYAGQWNAVIGFLPSIYAQAGIVGMLAGVLTAIASLVNIVGSIAAGRLLHQGICARHLIYTGFLCMAAGAFLALGEPTADAPVLRFVAVVMFSAVGGLIPGALFSVAVHVAPSERTVSTTVGWMQQGSATGSFVLPPLVAWVAGQVGGWEWTWAVTGSCCVLGMLLARGITYARHA